MKVVLRGVGPALLHMFEPQVDLVLMGQAILNLPKDRGDTILERQGQIHGSEHLRRPAEDVGETNSLLLFVVELLRVVHVRDAGLHEVKNLECVKC